MKNNEWVETHAYSTKMYDILKIKQKLTKITLYLGMFIFHTIFLVYW